MTIEDSSPSPASLRPAPLLLVLLMSALLAACGNWPVTASGNLSTPYTFQVNDWVYRNPPAIYVHPEGTPADPPRGLFVPLRVTQVTSNPATISRNLSRQVWQVWLSQRAFSTLEYDENATPFLLSESLALARRKGAQLLVGGYITHFLDGGTVGDSAVSMAIEIYDVATGVLLWSMAQGGSMDQQYANNFYIFQVQARMPADPVGLILRTLASDMGMEVYYWVYPYARNKSGGGKAF